MLDQSNDEMQAAQAELARLQAEVERLRVQTQLAKLRAEAERLKAEMSAAQPTEAAAAVSPPSAPQPIAVVATSNGNGHSAAAEAPPAISSSAEKPAPSLEQPAKSNSAKEPKRSTRPVEPGSPRQTAPKPDASPNKTRPDQPGSSRDRQSASPPPAENGSDTKIKQRVPSPPASKDSASPPASAPPGSPVLKETSAAVTSAEMLLADPSPKSEPAAHNLKTEPVESPTVPREAAPPAAPEKNAEKPAPKKPAAPPGALPVAAEEDTPEPFFSRKSFEKMGAFSVSMIAHALFLIILGCWVVPVVMQEQLETLVASQERGQEELTKVMSEDTQASSEVSLTSASSSSSSASLASAALPTGHGGTIQGGAAPAMDRTVADSVAAAGSGVSFNDVSLWGVGEKDMKRNVADGAPGDPSQIVDSYAEAMDRITHEILMNLLKSDVLVLWLFDQSESMKDDQVEIRERVDRVYQELGITPAAKGDHLLTAIGSYGNDFMLHTKKPTSKISEIRAAIDMVPVDPTGKENMCPAVGLMINQHRKYAIQGKRQLMLILVTDESGEQEDNEKNLELAIDEAKSAHCPIYVLGREAVFGYPYAFMNYTEPTTQLNFWLQINRGPETPYPEQLQTNGFYRRYDAHPSGFGPYEQTRMARETGGVFFLLPSPEVNLVARDDRKYELEAMKPYLPDLKPRKVYAAERDKSELRSTLWKVITDLNPYNPVVQPHIEMRHSFSIRPEDFYQQVAQEHAKAVQYFIYLDRCEKALEKIKKLRDKESSPRWRANYDILFAQVLAYKVRLYEYGAYLEAFAKKPKPIKNPFGPLKKTTHWEMANRAETITGDLTKSYIARSKKMFEDIIKNHSGTPFAARAQWELSRGFGIELVEDYDDPRRVGLSVKLPNY